MLAFGTGVSFTECQTVMLIFTSGGKAEHSLPPPLNRSYHSHLLYCMWCLGCQFSENAKTGEELKKHGEDNKRFTQLYLSASFSPLSFSFIKLYFAPSLFLNLNLFHHFLCPSFLRLLMFLSEGIHSASTWLIYRCAYILAGNTARSPAQRN